MKNLLPTANERFSTQEKVIEDFHGDKNMEDIVEQAKKNKEQTLFEIKIIHLFQQSIEETDVKN